MSKTKIWRGHFAALLAFFSFGSSSADAPPPDEPLWIAVVRTDGVLIPIARHAEGDWTLPWSQPFEPHIVAQIDTGGVLTPWHKYSNGRPPWSLPIDAGDPQRPKITVPTKWYLYTAEELGTTLNATQLMLAKAYCLQNWALLTDWKKRERLTRNETHNLAGLAFDRWPDEIVHVQDIPHLARIKTELGLLDGTGPMAARVIWLGFYRLQNRIIGVFHHKGYEGGSYKILEIREEQGKIVASAYGGGC